MAIQQKYGRLEGILEIPESASRKKAWLYFACDDFK